MKILCVLNTGQFSGAENVVCQIIQMMKPEKNIEIAYCSRDGQIRTILEEKRIKFIPVKNLSVKELRKVIKNYKPDIIHAHDMYASVCCAVACGKIPLISHIHNNAYNSRRISLKSITYLIPAIKAKHIFWVSESSFKGYKFHKLFECKSEILYNVIDIDTLYKKMSEDINTYDYDVVYVGRLIYPKNLERLMNVYSNILKKIPNAKIAVVGTGNLEKKLKRICDRMNIRNNVTFKGFCENPLKMMHDAKVMIMTSRWEGTPICALEAMALGLPIVSTPTDGLKDLVDDKVNGFLSDSDDELVEKAISIINDEKLYYELSNASKDKSKVTNNIENYKCRIISAYVKCIE